MNKSAKPIDVNKIDDPEALRNLMANARRLGSDQVYRDAFRRLCEVEARQHAGEVEIAFWKAIYAAEALRTEANNRTTLLSRTRQKIVKDGIVKTIEDLARRKQPSPGFKILVDGGLPELTAEYIVLTFPERFSDAALTTARTRLTEYNISLPSGA